MQKCFSEAILCLSAAAICSLTTLTQPVDDLYLVTKRVLAGQLVFLRSTSRARTILQSTARSGRPVCSSVRSAPERHPGSCEGP
jgi:hypothetical protein